MPRERLIGLLWVLGGLLPIAALAWTIADHAALPPLPDGTTAPGELGPDLVFLVAYAPLAYVGASLAMGPAPAPIAWAMLAVATANGMAGFTGQYAIHGLVVEPGSLPGAEAAALVSGTCFGLVANILAGALVLPLLPTGRLSSRAARLLAVAGLSVGFLMLIAGLLAPGPLQSFGLVENPLGVAGAKPLGAVVVLWPVCVGAIGIWLIRYGEQLLARIGWLSILVSASGAVFGLAGRPDLIWISALIVLVLLAELTLLTARHERLWGLPTLMHRTVLWLVLTSVLALAYGAAVGVAAALGDEFEGAARWAAIAVAVALAAAARTALDAWGRRSVVGEGADPARAVARLRERLDAPRDAPQALVDAVATAVRADHVTLDLLAGGHLIRAAEGGARPRYTTWIRLRNRGQSPVYDLDTTSTPGSDPGIRLGYKGSRRRPRSARVAVVPGDRLAFPLAGGAPGVLAVALPRGDHLPAAEQALLRELCALAAPALAAWARARGDVGDVLDVARLDAIAAELRALDALDPAERAAALEQVDREVARMLDGVRALARNLATDAADAVR